MTYTYVRNLRPIIRLIYNADSEYTSALVHSDSRFESIRFDSLYESIRFVKRLFIVTDHSKYQYQYHLYFYQLICLLYCRAFSAPQLSV